MKTEHLINYNRATIQEFYGQGIITSAQYEAYGYIWVNAQFRYSNPIAYKWSDLLEDARKEFWKMYYVLPAQIQKRLDQAVSTNKPYYWK